jgi:uncharacterized repeat protein (TIGR04076 family)
MNKLTVSVTKILGACTSLPPMEKGDWFSVEDGDIRLPDGRSFCVWAMQSILPLLPAKERRISEGRAEDWMWRVHHVQCPDPNGRVVFKIEKRPSRKTDSDIRGAAAVRAVRPAAAGPRALEASPAPGCSAARVSPPSTGADTASPGVSSPIRPIRVMVEEVRGKCTSGMRTGDFFRLDGGRLSMPPGRHFCLYALQAVLPFVAAKQRRLDAGDWLESENRFICPDPAGNVILRIEPV